MIINCSFALYVILRYTKGFLKLHFLLAQFCVIGYEIHLVVYSPLTYMQHSAPSGGKVWNTEPLTLHHMDHLAYMRLVAMGEKTCMAY